MQYKSLAAQDLASCVHLMTQAELEHLAQSYQEHLSRCHPLIRNGLLECISKIHQQMRKIQIEALNQPK